MSANGTPLRQRGVWFWATVITIGSVLLLFVGSQIARSLGQDVDWYAGFGQWLGALGSLIAAGVALWIAVTGRREADAREKAEQDRQDADLARQAGLVQVAAKMLSRRQAAGPNYSHPGISVRNRRPDRIFEISVVRYMMLGKDVDMEVGDVGGIDLKPRDRNGWYFGKELPTLVLESDHVLSIYPKGGLDLPADYVAVEYTDSAGRRWRIDSEGEVTRL